jgi:hypothetical protein
MGLTIYLEGGYVAPSGGRRENFWGIPCEKSRFYAKKSYFSNFRGGGHEIFGVFHVKNLKILVSLPYNYKPFVWTVQF